jgi:hypothetical protein
MFRRTSAKMASAPTEFIVASGSCCWFKELLQERPHMARVWLATSHVLHPCSLVRSWFLYIWTRSVCSDNYEKVWPQLPQSSFIRLPCDTIPSQQILVYKYWTHNFLNVVKEGLHLRARKQILIDSPRGIAELHDRDVVNPGTPHCHYCSVSEGSN